MKIVTSKKTLQKIEVTKEFNNCYVWFVLNEDWTRRMIEPPTNKNWGWTHTITKCNHKKITMYWMIILFCYLDIICEWLCICSCMNTERFWMIIIKIFFQEKLNEQLLIEKDQGYIFQ